MLLEYNVDTKDENMKDRAIELRRRVAGRKLNEALDDGLINSNDLLKLKEKNRDERKEHIREIYMIENAFQNERMSLARADQQLKAESQLKTLTRDVSRASRLSKAKYDVLTDLEARLVKARTLLKNPSNPPIEEVISKELQVDDRKQLDEKFGVCQCCSRKILLALLDNHLVMCERRKLERSPQKISLDVGSAAGKKQKPRQLSEEELRTQEEEQFARLPVYDIEQSVLTAVATFPPQKPRNCKVVSKGTTYIDWEWLPPVIDGGLAVTDYEIAFVGKHELFDRKKGKYKRWEEECSMLTSRFCYRHAAVAHTGFRLCGLRAGSEYTSFRLRCRNMRGWSEWAEMLEDEDDPLQKLLKQQQKTASSGSDGVFQLDPGGGKQNSIGGGDDDSSVGGMGSKSGGSTVQTSTNGGAETFIERQKRLRLSVGKNVPTLEPESPTAPLFFNCNRITSSCIHLDWSAPFYDGGVPIRDYIVHYTVKECQTTVTARNVVFEHVLKFKVGSGDATTAVIRHLPPNTDVVHIFIIAVNEVGLVSPKGLLKQNLCRTADTSRHGQLSRELAAAAATPGPYFDSDFYTGVRQRLNRLEHMKQLSEELEITEPDGEEEEEEKEWAAILELETMKKLEEEAEKKRQEELNLSDNEEEIELQEQALQGKVEGFIFTMRQRRNHFKRKLFALDKKIRDLKKERMDIDAFRTKCTLEMRSKEKQLLSYKLEVERLRQYTGVTVTSSVLAGFIMQYKTVDYTKRIEQAFETCLKEIATIKYQVISGENRRIKAKEELELAEQTKLERTAKFYEFEQDYQRRKKVLSKLAGTDADPEVLYVRYFRLLQKHTADRKAERTKITDTFMNLIARYLKSAFEKWRYGEFRATSSSDTAMFTSKGGVMLQQAAEKRTELQQLLREAISGAAVIKQKIDMAGLSRDRQLRLAASQDFKGMEEGLDHADMYSVRGLKMLYEGDGYAQLNKFDLAKHLYEAQIMWIRSRPKIDIKILAICHGRLGKMFLKLGKKNRAIVEFDRQLSLAKEIQDKPEEADAYYGLGAGYLSNYDYENAVRYLNIAQTLFNGLGSAAKYSGALRALRECYECMSRPDKMQLCSDRINEIENELSEKIALANFKISDMKSRLVHTAAEIELIVQIERTTFRAMALKAMIRERELLLETLEAELAEQNDKCGAIALLLDAIDKELQEAAETDEREMWSMLVHDQAQIVEVEELKIRLTARKKLELSTLETEQTQSKNIQVKIKNAEDEIAGADNQLVLEEGALMTHSRLDRPFRSIGLCAANAAGNEVTGTGTGGFEEFAAAEGPHIHMIDYHSGSVNHVYMGGSADLGHTGVVTCVLHDGKQVFSGSTDETIIAWDTSELRKRLRTFIGHEGSIVSLAVEGRLLASGGSDSTLRLWDKHTAQQLRVVYGHSRSVLSVEIGPTWMLTGSTDTEVRVWKIGLSKRGSLVVDCVYRLIGHESAVTCVRYGQMEVLSGDVKGRIFIWWMKTGEILRRCLVHTSPVKCMQFDSLHIVSGGADHSVCITDIATGEVLQTLRGHTMGVIALAFDSERIISVSGDNTLRYWQWGQSTAPTDKVHVLDKGETLFSVAKRYSIQLDDLMRWNGITDVRQCFAGMNLIVRKADPDKPTDAEKLLLQKEKRMEGGTRLAERVMKDTGATDAMLEEGAKLFKYNRVHKIATDIDFFSLGNRLFGEQKRQLELFPDQINPNVNTRSLAGRFRADEERRKEEKIAEGRGMSDHELAAQHGIDNEEDAALLAWALKTGSKVRPRFFLSGDNEDEWGEVADGLAVVMLQMLVEYEAYDVVMEQKRQLRSKQSVIGRINTRQIEIDHQKKLAAELAAAALQATLHPSMTNNNTNINPSTAVENGAAVSEDVDVAVDGGAVAGLAHGGEDIVPAVIAPTTTSTSTTSSNSKENNNINSNNSNSSSKVPMLPPIPGVMGQVPSLIGTAGIANTEIKNIMQQHDNDETKEAEEKGEEKGLTTNTTTQYSNSSRLEEARRRRDKKEQENAKRKEAIKRAIAGGRKSDSPKRKRKHGNDAHQSEHDDNMTEKPEETPVATAGLRLPPI